MLTNVNVKRKKWDSKWLTQVGGMAAVLCILGPLSIPLPISPVPISLTNFAVLLESYVLGMRRGVVSYLIYLLIGFVGLPVFSGFTGGASKLFGPTGGYLIGFIAMSFVSGLFFDKCRQRALHFIGMLIGMTVCYLFGTVWLAWQSGMTVQGAFAAGVLPFLPADVLKVILCILTGPKVRKRLRKAGLV